MVNKLSSNRVPEDPHPANEEKYDKQRHPGGANPPKGPDAGVEVERHDGVPPARPRNAETGEN